MEIKAEQIRCFGKWCRGRMRPVSAFGPNLSKKPSFRRDVIGKASECKECQRRKAEGAEPPCLEDRPWVDAKGKTIPPKGITRRDLERELHCPECGERLRLKQGKNIFWGCSGYPQCSYTLSLELGRKVAKLQKRAEKPKKAAEATLEMPCTGCGMPTDFFGECPHCKRKSGYQLMAENDYPGWRH